MIGQTLGPYRIVGKLGAGGMGEVYRATDPRLRRDVAIKILPEAFAADADRLARFEREARVLASLNHPHIGGIHGLEEDGDVRALVLELVEGPTLAERLISGPLSVHEALTYSRQIAEALEAAHDKGICHRDLKPSNIKITPGGQAKVLDFGLAKADEVAVGDVSHSPTITALGTATNVILGTAAYMSPEQARGKAVDRRADVWAFGCVLFEMLTARQAFAGETVVDTLSAIVSREPEWHRLPAETPSAIRRLLQRCLAKDLKRRMHDIADARIEIEDVLEAGGDIPATEQRSRAAGVSRGTVALLSVALVGIGLAAGVLFGRSMPSNSTSAPHVIRYTIPLDGITAASPPRISRDGRQVAFVASKGDGSSAIWIQALEGGKPRELPGTSGASLPFWSPDGRSLGFFADGALKRIDLTSGASQRIARAEEPIGGAWSSSGVIVFSERYVLYQVPASGGTPTLVASLDLSRQENQLRLPEFLPDGRRFLYSARAGRTENTSVYLASLDGGPPKRILNTRWVARHAAPDVLMYVRDDTLVAQSFDVDRGSLTGTPRQILGPIDANLPAEFFSVSDTGAVVYRLVLPTPSQLTWVDRSGAIVSAVAEPSEISNFRLSPDEHRVVFDETTRGSRSVWTLDFDTSARSRLTFPGSDDWQPIWSPDGLRVLFGSYRNGPIDMYIKPASGGANDQEFMRSPIQKGPRDWSRDGRFILYTQDSPELKEDLYARPVEDTATPIAIAVTNAREFDGRFSPDGRWVSYVSTETGANEIYVQPFPPTGGKWQVSTGGGHSPRWRGDGRELYYLTPRGEMKTAPITATTGPFVTGAARTLFRVGAIRSGAPGNTTYEVTRDGQRFLLNQLQGSPAPPSISVILNWAASP